MMIYTLERTQFLNCDIDEAWAFFTNPNNLAAITPDDLNFQVLGAAAEQKVIFPGMLIDYKVSPLFGIRLSWQTEITEVTKNRSFVDFQKKGPYKLWEHRHEFFEENGGVRMLDTVRYALPFGPIGRLAHRVIVKKKLDEIFDYRRQVLNKILNDPIHG